MPKKKSPLRQRYFNYVTFLICWSIALGIVLVALLFFIIATPYKDFATPAVVILGVLGLLFPVHKAMDFRCPKCKKVYDMRSWPKFCPHCGAPLETDELDSK